MTTTLYQFKQDFKKFLDHFNPDYSKREATHREYAEHLMLDTMTGGFDNDSESRD